MAIFPVAAASRFLLLFHFSVLSLSLSNLFFSASVSPFKTRSNHKKITPFFLLERKENSWRLLLHFPSIPISSIALVSKKKRAFFFGLEKSKTQMATNIGMMDSAYFVGRNEILTWINDRLQLNLSRVEEVFLLLVYLCMRAFSNSSLVMLIWELGFWTLKEL